MAKIITPREAGERLGLTHLEVIRRIRKKDIQAKKLGWNWVIREDEIDRVKRQSWYKNVMAVRARREAQLKALDGE